MAESNIRMLTDADIQAIVAALQVYHDLPEGTHHCRFTGVDTSVVKTLSEIDPKVLLASVKFYDEMSKAMSETRATVRKTIVTILVGTVITILGFGLKSYIK